MPEDPKITRILDKITAREKATDSLRSRMDRDQNMYTLQPFKPPVGDGMRPEDAYTSPRPMIVADKLIGAIGSAETTVRVFNDADLSEKRDVNNNYERLGIGMLRNIDRSLLYASEHALLYQLGSYAVVRGAFVAARALLRKDSDGSTYEDVKPIDPRHLVFEMGHREPNWAAIISMRSRNTLRDEYPKLKFDDEDQDDGERLEKVIDYYYREGSGKSKKYMNCVIIAGQYSKKPANTFAEKFPIIIRACGPNPGFRAYSLNESHYSSPEADSHHWGESVFAPIRETTPFLNRLRTYRMSLTRSAVQRIYKIHSPDGEYEIDGGIDESTREMQLPQNVDVDLLEVAQTTKDTDALEVAVDVDNQDSTLPEQSYGRLDAAISGRALRILGASIGERLEPFIRPVESCVEGVIEALSSQYETGRYKDLNVSGKTYDSADFNRAIKPSDIKGHGLITVKLEPSLPEDQLEKWQMAAVANTPGSDGLGIVSKQTIHDTILNLQDSNLERTRQYASMARASTPTMLLMTQLEAAYKSQDQGAIQFLTREIQRLEEQKQMEEVARRMAFFSMMQQSPIQGAANGVQDSQPGGGGGQNPNGSQRNPTTGLPPEAAPLSGSIFGVSTGPSEPGARPSRPEDIGLVSVDQR